MYDSEGDFQNIANAVVTSFVVGTSPAISTTRGRDLYRRIYRRLFWSCNHHGPVPKNKLTYGDAILALIVFLLLLYGILFIRLVTVNGGKAFDPTHIRHYRRTFPDASGRCVPGYELATLRTSPSTTEQTTILYFQNVLHRLLTGRSVHRCRRCRAGGYCSKRMGTGEKGTHIAVTQSDNIGHSEKTAISEDGHDEKPCFNSGCGPSDLTYKTEQDSKQLSTPGYAQSDPETIDNFPGTESQLDIEIILFQPGYLPDTGFGYPGLDDKGTEPVDEVDNKEKAGIPRGMHLSEDTLGEAISTLSDSRDLQGQDYGIVSTEEGDVEREEIAERDEADRDSSNTEKVGDNSYNTEQVEIGAIVVITVAETARSEISQVTIGDNVNNEQEDSDSDDFNFGELDEPPSETTDADINTKASEVGSDSFQGDPSNGVFSELTANDDQERLIVLPENGTETQIEVEEDLKSTTTDDDPKRGHVSDEEEDVIEPQEASQNFIDNAKDDQQHTRDFRSHFDDVDITAIEESSGKDFVIVAEEATPDHAVSYEVDNIVKSLDTEPNSIVADRSVSQDAGPTYTAVDTQLSETTEVDRIGQQITDIDNDYITDSSESGTPVIPDLELFREEMSTDSSTNRYTIESEASNTVSADYTIGTLPASEHVDLDGLGYILSDSFVVDNTLDDEPVDTESLLSVSEFENSVAENENENIENSDYCDVVKILDELVMFTKTDNLGSLIALLSSQADDLYKHLEVMMDKELPLAALPVSGSVGFCCTVLLVMLLRKLVSSGRARSGGWTYISICGDICFVLLLVAVEEEMVRSRSVLVTLLLYWTSGLTCGIHLLDQFTRARQGSYLKYLSLLLGLLIAIIVPFFAMECVWLREESDFRIHEHLISLHYLYWPRLILIPASLARMDCEIYQQPNHAVQGVHQVELLLEAVKVGIVGYSLLNMSHLALVSSLSAMVAVSAVQVLLWELMSGNLTDIEKEENNGSSEIRKSERGISSDTLESDAGVEEVILRKTNRRKSETSGLESILEEGIYIEKCDLLTERGRLTTNRDIIVYINKEIVEEKVIFLSENECKLYLAHMTCSSDSLESVLQQVQINPQSKTSSESSNEDFIIIPKIVVDSDETTITRESDLDCLCIDNRNETTIRRKRSKSAEGPPDKSGSELVDLASLLGEEPERRCQSSLAFSSDSCAACRKTRL